jgi:hypothetical protein
MLVKHPTVRVLATTIALVVGAMDLRSQASFPPAASILYDAKHKEPKSGVQQQGNTIVIQQGVGMPTTINVIAFSRDAKLLVAGKDFGRVVIWDVPQRAVIRAKVSLAQSRSLLITSPLQPLEETESPTSNFGILLMGNWSAGSRLGTRPCNGCSLLIMVRSSLLKTIL